MSKWESFLKFIGASPVKEIDEGGEKRAVFGALAAALEARDSQSALILMDGIWESTDIDPLDCEDAVSAALANMEEWAASQDLYRAASFVMWRIEDGSEAQLDAMNIVIAHATEMARHDFSLAGNDLRYIIRNATDRATRNKAVDKAAEIALGADDNALPAAFEMLKGAIFFLGEEDARRTRLVEACIGISTRAFAGRPALFFDIVQHLRDTGVDEELSEAFRKACALKYETDEKAYNPASGSAPINLEEFQRRLKAKRPSP